MSSQIANHDLGPSLSTMTTTFEIQTNGRVYMFSRCGLNFETALKKAHLLLRGTSKGKATFDALHQGISSPYVWHLRDDVVRPFGDGRQRLRSIFTFNLDKDLLLYSDESGNIQISLAHLRSSGPDDTMQRSDFTPYQISLPSPLDLALFPPPYRTPSIPVCDRRFAFSSRVLLDFASQWRHILRSSYAESTFLRLAKAVISLARCHFHVEEVSERKRLVPPGKYVSVLDVPSWKPYDCRVFCIGHVTVILNQDLYAGLQIAKNHAKDRRNRDAGKTTTRGGRAEEHTYLLLSIRYLSVCYSDSTGAFSYTAPTLLLDGLTPPSSVAIRLLLQVLPLPPPPPQTPIHKLPLEIQDRILEHLSAGSVEIARLGCLLRLGSCFNWMRAIDWPRRTGPIQVAISRTRRLELSPVESKICFGGVFSGLSYQ